MSSKRQHEETKSQRAVPKPKSAETTQQHDRPQVDPARAALDNATITALQQTVGNSAVQRFIAQRSSDSGGPVNDNVADQIDRERGGGQALDSSMAQRAGSAMGQDFSGVRVHTDANADQLNQQLGARAFATGNDVFFRDGAYDPGSSDGQRLIAHELTHVAQQGGAEQAVQAKMMVNTPGDAYEQEADAVADQVMTMPEDAIQREAVEEEEDMIQREAVEEEEELQI